MSKVYAGLLVVGALIATAAIGTLSLVVVTDVGFVAYRLLKPGKYPWRGADRGVKMMHFASTHLQFCEAI